MLESKVERASLAGRTMMAVAGKDVKSTSDSDTKRKEMGKEEKWKEERSNTTKSLRDQSL